MRLDKKAPFWKKLIIVSAGPILLMKLPSLRIDAVP
jgi:hypothetical protein